MVIFLYIETNCVYAIRCLKYRARAGLKIRFETEGSRFGIEFYEQVSSTRQKSDASWKMSILRECGNSGVRSRSVDGAPTPAAAAAEMKESSRAAFPPVYSGLPCSDTPPFYHQALFEPQVHH